MDIPFWKMHGAANDFILVDDREETFPAEDRAWIASVCARRTGVGSDGLMLIQPSQRGDFRMKFFNPDGSDADMCGNGARCIALLAGSLGICGEEAEIETAAGPVKAWIRDDRVCVELTPPVDWRMDLSLDLDGKTVACHFVNTGNPHAVRMVGDVKNLDIKQQGRAIRMHEAFQPLGANANFVSVADTDRLRVRTYERGVEDETLACGTGITASALVAHRLGRISLPVKVVAASGDVLEVDAREDRVTLTGPAMFVFKGVLTYPG